jgi:hypothetical protein
LAISESATLETALQVALQQVCEATGWKYGELGWLTQLKLGCNVVRLGTVILSLSNFRILSQKMQFTSGVGLPGRVWANQKPEWIQDVSQEAATSFLRTEIALEAGLKQAGSPYLGTRGSRGCSGFFYV